MPRSASLVSPPQSSPFSPTKFENRQITECNSGIIIAGIGEAPQGDHDTVLDNHAEEDFSRDLQFQERGGSQPSAMSLPTTGVHGDMKHNTGTYYNLRLWYALVY